MHQLRSLRAIRSQASGLCFHRPIFSRHFLGCNLSGHGGASRLLVAQGSSRKLSLQCRQAQLNLRRQHGASGDESSYSPSGSVGTLPSKVFVGHSIYKGKAALAVEPRAPEFTYLDSGACKLSKEGFVLLEFAPVAGVRTYDWSRKQVFSLTVTEIATLIGLGASDSCEFFHDPNKGRSDEGTMSKILKVEPIPDGSGHFFKLNVQNKKDNVNANINIPVTKAELRLLVSAFNFILPYLLGWHAYADTIRPEVAQTMNNANPNYSGDSQWGKN